MDIVKCPVCGELLKQYQAFYRCQKNHSFDIAKEGYTNLLLNQSSKIHGDAKDMLQARKYIQEQGYYQSVAKTIVSMMNDLSKEQIVDIGCGIGYYSAFVQEAFHTNVIGIDISKDALKMAAKKNASVGYYVASNKSLPLMDQSADLIMNIFSPVYITEVKRVLNTHGYIIVVSANKDHLIELKEIIYEDIHDKDELRNDIEDDAFKLVNETSVKESMIFDKKSLDNLFLMTPHYWTSSIKGKEKLAEIDELLLSIDVSVKLYQLGK